MSKSLHPIYGDLVYQQTLGNDAGRWFLADGDWPLSVIEWHVDEGRPPLEIVENLVPRSGRSPSIETIEGIAAARRSFWERQQDRGTADRTDIG